MKQLHDGLLATTIALMAAFLVHTHAERQVIASPAVAVSAEYRSLCAMAATAGW